VIGKPAIAEQTGQHGEGLVCKRLVHKWFLEYPFCGGRSRNGVMGNA
jgi:hypothetical protein